MSSNRLLANCESWPTSHTMPVTVRRRLDFLTHRLRMTGRPARAQDTLNVLIICFAPSDPVVMGQLLCTPHPLLRSTVAQLPTGRAQGRLGAATEQVWLELLSPASLKVNSLIAALHDRDIVTTRRQVVSAIVLHCAPDDVDTLAHAGDRLPTLTVKAAAVDGRPIGDVLSLKPPNAGRRPLDGIGLKR